MRRPDRDRAAIVLLASLFTASCGYVGEPLAPALNIASTIRDLRVVEYGDRVTVNFTIPPLTTEGLVLKYVGAVDLRVGIGPNPFDLSRWAEVAHKVTVDAEKVGSVQTSFPAAEWVGKEVVVAVRLVNAKGRPSEWSNLAVLSVIPPVAPPAGMAAQSAPQGVRITWQSAEHSFRVFRRGPSEKEPSLIGTSDSTSYSDNSAQFGSAYEYQVQAVRDHAESTIAGPVAITPKDEFPPAVPSGLSAVAGTSTVELVWERNVEPDLRGYRVYRALEASQFERLSDFTETPAYSDHQVVSGRKYRYAVSALDQTGNESAKSPAVEITAP